MTCAPGQKTLSRPTSDVRSPACSFEICCIVSGTIRGANLSFLLTHRPLRSRGAPVATHGVVCVVCTHVRALQPFRQDLWRFKEMEAVMSGFTCEHLPWMMRAATWCCEAATTIQRAAGTSASFVVASNFPPPPPAALLSRPAVEPMTDQLTLHLASLPRQMHRVCTRTRVRSVGAT